MEFQSNTILGLVTTDAMNPDDLDEPVENGLTPMFLRLADSLLHRFTVQWVASLKTVVKLANCFVVSKTLSRECGVTPTNRKTIVGRAETTTENIIESVEVASPLCSWYQNRTNLIIELFQSVELCTVDCEYAAHAPNWTYPTAETAFSIGSDTRTRPVGEGTISNLP